MSLPQRANSVTCATLSAEITATGCGRGVPIKVSGWLVGLGVGDRVAVGVEVLVLLGDGVVVGVEVSVSVGDGVVVRVEVFVLVGDGVSVGIWVAVWVGNGVFVAVGVFVGASTTRISSVGTS